MNLSDLELLLVLVEERNITKAAERLYSSQSTLSYRIKQMENEMGCILFERNKTGITPTRECTLATQFAQKTLAEYELLLAQFMELRTQSKTSEQLRLGATTAIAIRFFQQILRSFQGSYPYASISWVANTSAKIIEELRNESIDVAIVRGEIQWSGEKELLFEEPVYLISRHPIDMEKLPDATYLTQPNIYYGRLPIWWEEQYGKLPDKTMVIDTVDGCLQLVDQNLGFAILPALTFAGKKKYYTKQIFWKDGRPLTQKTWCLCRENYETPISRAFFDFVKETLPKQMNDVLLGMKI